MARFAFFALPLLFYPGFTESSNTPKWIALGLILPLVLWRAEIPWTPANKWLLAFLGVVAVTSLWAVSWLDAAYLGWHLALVVAAFFVGTTLKDLRGTLIAMAWGVAVSAPIAFAQWYAPDLLTGIIPQAVMPAGLFMNKNILAEASFLALAVCVVTRHWYPAPLLLLGWLLPFSKGALIALVVPLLVYLWRRSRLAAITVTLIGALAVGGVVKTEWFDTAGETATAARGQLILNSARLALDHPFGVGPGGFWQTYPLYFNAVAPTNPQVYSALHRPKHPHNDALMVLAEYGVLGFLCLFMVCWHVLRSENDYRYIFAAFLGLGLFAYPLFLPLSAFIGAVVAGHVCRYRYPLRSRFGSRQRVFYEGQHDPERGGQGVVSGGGGQHIPV